MEKIPSLFKIRIRGIAIGAHEVNLSAAASALDIPVFFGQIRAEGELKVSDRLELHLQVYAEGSFVCDRCAKEFFRVLSPPLDLYYFPPQLSKDIEEDDDIHVYDSQHTHEIDFTEDVRDALFLAIPMKNLCQPDCPGVEFVGKEVIVDERLAALGGLYDRLKKEEMNSDGPLGVSQG